MRLSKAIFGLAAGSAAALMTSACSEQVPVSTAFCTNTGDGIAIVAAPQQDADGKMVSEVAYDTYGDEITPTPGIDERNVRFVNSMGGLVVSPSMTLTVYGDDDGNITKCRIASDSDGEQHFYAYKDADEAGIDSFVSLDAQAQELNPSFAP